MRPFLLLALTLMPTVGFAQQLPAPQPQPNAWSSHQQWQQRQDLQILNQRTEQLQMQQRQLQQQQILQQTLPPVR